MHAHLTPNVSFFTKHIRLLSCQRPLANSISNTIILGRSTCTQYNKVTSSRCINQNQCAPVLKGTFGLPLPSCSCSVNLKGKLIQYTFKFITPKKCCMFLLFSPLSFPACVSRLKKLTVGNLLQISISVHTKTTKS